MKGLVDPPVLFVERSLLYARYGIEPRQFNRWRKLLGHNTQERNPRLPIKEVNELEDLWVATDRDWGLGWTLPQFNKYVLSVRDRNPAYSFNAYLTSHYKISRDEYLRRSKIPSLQDAIALNPSGCLIDVSAR